MRLEEQLAQRNRELERAVRQLEEQNASLEEFVYIASHDLQEPVRTIMGYLQLIDQRYEEQLAGEGKEFIDFALDGAQHLQSLIEGLLVYSRFMRQERDHEEFELADALASATLALAHRIDETGTEVDASGVEGISASGDQVLIAQVLQNLIDNAIKFSDPPAKVTVAADVRDAEVEVRVSDQGRGFDPRHADRIFKIFSRLRRDGTGTGLGLAVCRRIIERHEGRIWAESEPGVGTTIGFTLPRT